MDVPASPVRVPVPTRTRAPTGITNAYVVGSDGALLVDPGARSADLDRRVRDRGLDGVLVTHAHADHVGAVADYASEHDATIWALDGYEERLADVAEIRPDRAFADGDAVEAGDGTRLVALTTPGHAPDHVAFEVGNGVLVGDLAVAEGSVVVGDEGDISAYLDSLDRVRDRDPAVLYPGHGPVVDSPGETLSWLRDHRLEREQRVLEAVGRGHETPAAIVDAAYGKELSGVRDLAEATVRAHLRKLADGGRIRWDGERARPS